jgi:hypothetical protein
LYVSYLVQHFLWCLWSSIFNIPAIGNFYFEICAYNLSVAPTCCPHQCSFKPKPWASYLEVLYKICILKMASYLLIDCDFTWCKLCPRAEHWTVDACNSQSPLRILQDKQQLSGCKTNEYFKILKCLKDLSNLEILLRDYLKLFIVAASECMLESLFTVAAT